MDKIVVLTGAGISAESGLSTFRDSGGLWDSYDIMDVASIEGWNRNCELVLEFYNERRKQAHNAKPNAGHLALVELERYYDVTIITQNVDNLHEKAGSSKVIHLHGELSKVRSSIDEHDVYDICDARINIGDYCKKGSQLRPHIVWFGELVPKMDEAIELAENANIFIILGTSLAVYPAAGLIDYVPNHTPIYVVDPVKHNTIFRSSVSFIEGNATVGVPQLVKQLIEDK
ncbi:MAG: NAD-dependent deacylase [Balneolales bacterium]